MCVCVCDPRGEESSNFLRTESEREQRKIETKHGDCAERGEREGVEKAGGGGGGVGGMGEV